MNFPDRSLVGDAGPVKNPANTHIIRHAGRYLRPLGGGSPDRGDRVDLDTIGEYDFDGKLRGSMTAHPRLDPRTGEMFFFAYSVFEPVIRYYVVDANRRARAPRQDRDPGARDDARLRHHRGARRVPRLAHRVRRRGPGDRGSMVSWRPENGTRIGVMPRLGTADEMRWFEIDPGHVQHFWNAWVDGDRIELSGSPLHAPRVRHRLRGPARRVDRRNATPRVSDPVLGRPRADKAGWEQFDDLGGDFCRFNDDLDGVRSRYHYMSAFLDRDRRIGDFDTIVKYDDLTGERQVWSAGPTGHVGETRVRPRPRRHGRGRRLAAERGPRLGHEPHRRVHPRRPRHRRRPRRPGAPAPSRAVRLPRQLVRRRLTPPTASTVGVWGPRVQSSSSHSLATSWMVPWSSWGTAAISSSDELVGEAQAIDVDRCVDGGHPRRVQDHRYALLIGAPERGDRARADPRGVEDLDPEPAVGQHGQHHVAVVSAGLTSHVGGLRRSMPQWRGAKVGEVMWSPVSG